MAYSQGELNHEALWQQRLDRQLQDAAVSSYAAIDCGSESLAIYSRLQEIEDKLFPGGDYLVGSARIDDEVLVLDGLREVLLTAEHASIHRRSRNDKIEEKEADMGTGALAVVVAEDTNSTALIAVGRQTADANDTEEHPLKLEAEQIVEQVENSAHLALHMLDRGRASEPDDSRGYSVVLGIGEKPSDATLELKDRMKEIGNDLGLRVGVNVPFITFRNRQLIINEDGSLKTFKFASSSPKTTRSFSQSIAEQIGKNDSFAAVQMEMNEVLLVRQNDEVGYPSEADRELGAYLGYLFVKGAVESVTAL